MSKIELNKHPFNLNKEQIKWVEDTINNMSLEEKIGQLFFPIGFTTKKKELKETIQKYKPGGMMYRTSKAKKVITSHRVLQENSKIPMFLAANLESGGNGIIAEGTYFGENMLIGAINDVKYAAQLGEVCAKEGSMVGCNMAFAPVIDLNLNFRNPVTNTRAFSDNPELVATMGAAYVKEMQKNNMCVTIKHFPGDGVDARDHHLLTTSNSLPYKKWLSTFGYIYKTNIEAGARGLMVGHITLPDYFNHFPEGKDEYSNIPASLNPYLINNLLRGELDYQGLIITDATLMTGFGVHGKREDLVPRAIAAGCDMFLFNRSLDDDFNSMIKGYKNGVLTDKRLNEALTRILGLKASLNLHTQTLEELVPDFIDQELLDKHKKWSKEAALKSITLVKADLKILPLNVHNYKKIGVMYFGNQSMVDQIFENLPGIKGVLLKMTMKVFSKKKSHPQMLIEALKTKGFAPFLYDFGDIFKVLKESNMTMEEWRKQFDLIIILSKMEHESNLTSLQVQYKAMGFDAPWFVKEVPTILISTSNPYQQYDFNMIDTVINAYSPKEDVYNAIVEKLVGESPFTGTSPVSLDFEEYK